MIRRRTVIRDTFIASFIAVLLCTGATPNIWLRKPPGCVYGNDFTGARTTDTTGKVGTLTNGASLSGNTVVTDGANDFLSVADSNDLSATDGAGNDTPISVVCWFYGNSLPANSPLVAKAGSSSTYEWVLRANGGGNAMFVFLNTTATAYIGQAVGTAPTFSTSTWHMMTGVYSASETTAGIKIYINGSLASTTAFSTGTYTGTSNTASVMSIGGALNGAESLNGKIGTTLVFKRELSAAEVAKLWNQGKSRIANGGTP